MEMQRDRQRHAVFLAACTFIVAFVAVIVVILSIPNDSWILSLFRQWFWL